MVSPLCLVAALTLVAPAPAVDSDAAPVARYASSRTHINAYQQRRSQVSAALKDAATANDSQQAAAIKTLIDLEKRTSADAQLTPYQRSHLVNKLRRRISHQLRRLERDLLAQVVNHVPDRDHRGPIVQAANLDQVIPEVIEPQRWEAAGGAGRAVLFQQGPPAIGGDNGSQAGEGLVDLIQTVIAPESWEAVGGHGVIAVFGQ